MESASRTTLSSTNHPFSLPIRRGVKFVRGRAAIRIVAAAGH